MLRDDSTPSQAQLDDLVATTQAIELTYQSVKRTAATISLMYQQGQATCSTVRDYNLMAIAVYNTQAAMLQALTAAGQTGLPSAPPAPTLFNYTDPSTNVTAPLVSCTVDAAAAPTGLTTNDGSSGGTVQGALGRRYGLRDGTSAPPGVLPAGSLSITTSDPNWQNPQPTLTWINANSANPNLNGGLGDFGLTEIVIVGVIIGVSYIVASALIAWITQAYISKTVAQTVQAKQQAFEAQTNAITGCYQTCVAKGSDPSDCASSCSKAFPAPNLDSPMPPSNWGFFALVGLGAVAALGGVLLYRKYRRDGYILPPRGGHADVEGAVAGW